MKHIAVIWLMGDIPSNPDEFAGILDRFGFDGASFKILNGSTPYNQPNGPQPLKAYFDRLRELGYEVEAWGYHYSDNTNRQGEAIEEMRQKLGFSTYHLDLEAEWLKPYGMPAAFKALVNALKIGGFNVYVNSYRFPTYQPNFPWSAAALHEKVDGWTPQIYWALANNPVEQLDRCLREYADLNNEPVYPMGPIFGETFTLGGVPKYWEPELSELEEFRQACEQRGIAKVYWYRLGWCLKRGRYDLIKAATGVDKGETPPPPPPVSEQYEIVNCDWLNMREEPNPYVDNRLIIARAGTIVTDLGESDGNWKKVRVTVDAWAHSAYLKET